MSDLESQQRGGQQAPRPNPMDKSSLPVGSLFGLPIRVHYLYPLFLLILIVMSYIQDQDLKTTGVVAITGGPILLLTVLIHELGHSLAARMVGTETHGILLWPLGGLAFIGHSTTPKKDLWIALAGPLTHIPMFLFWVLVALPVYHAKYGTWSLDFFLWDSDSAFWYTVCITAVWMQIALFAFNLLLPAYPLDGGRVLADLLLICGTPVELAAKITVGVAVPIAGGIIIYGIVQFFKGGSFITVIVGLWMIYQSWSIVQCLQAGTIKGHPMFNYPEEVYYTTRQRDGVVNNPTYNTSTPEGSQSGFGAAFGGGGQGFGGAVQGVRGAMAVGAAKAAAAGGALGKALRK